MAKSVTKVAVSNRIHPDNYAWLKKKAVSLERSANWLLDKVITEAREADQAKENAPEAVTSDALVQ